MSTASGWGQRFWSPGTPLKWVPPCVFSRWSEVGLLLTVLRYLFLALLYVFLILVVRLMFSGLKQEQAIPRRDRQRPRPARDLQAPRPGGKLVVLTSSDPHLEKGAAFYLGEKLTLGRGEKNDLVILDPFSSQEHALVYMRNDQYWVQDLGSLNGTYLNEVRLERPTVLADGDRLRIGGVTFQFVRWAYEVESGQ
ncbi:MAG: FHA domain-containing protein [Thermoanaerobacteraceae bacterium]|nr:FHA domain-containing protein [Thermoanaerobacteraceae bacterium]